MPTTALKIGDTRLKFMTLITEPILSRDGQTTKQFITIELTECDNDFIPKGKGSLTIHEDTEENYHKNLRKEASEKGHFVSGESTNPEWNPDYKEEDFNSDGYPI